MPPWVIVTTRPAAEEAAERALRQAGYRAYFPRYRKLVLPHGQGRRPASAMRPLFARLVFVQDWHGWPDTAITGATGLMQSRPGAATLADADIALIMERERAGDFDMAAPRGNYRDDLAVGDDVEFDAAFGAKIIGVLDQLSPHGKAVVWAMMFDRVVRSEVDAGALRKA